jgi:hypothetical protein
VASLISNGSFEPLSKTRLSAVLTDEYEDKSVAFSNAGAGIASDAPREGMLS